MSFFVVGLVLALTQVSLLPALLGVFFGALTEAYSLVDDNIPIPLVSALVMSLVIYLI